MSAIDIHLAAASISAPVRDAFERLGLEEDFFYDCENCAPTLYHATLRSAPRGIDYEELWLKLCEIPPMDAASFTGCLEKERLVQAYQNSVEVEPGQVAPLPIQSCPPQTRKACDIHIGVRLDDAAHSTVAWLQELGIASFRKERADGEWRIFTATFDTRDAGERFFEWGVRAIPRARETCLKIKHEITESVFRRPFNAPMLPITYDTQFTDWAAARGY